MWEMNADEMEICKATLCMKEQEIYMLTAELTRRTEDVQTLALAIERLERSTSAAIDRVVRTLERLNRRINGDDRRGR